MSYPGLSDFRLLDSMKVGSAIYLSQFREEVDENSGIIEEFTTDELEPPSAIGTTRLLEYVFDRCMSAMQRRGNETLISIGKEFVSLQFDHLQNYTSSAAGRIHINNTKEFTNTIVAGSVRILAAVEEDFLLWTTLLSKIMEQKPYDEFQKIDWMGEMYQICAVTKNIILLKFEESVYPINLEQAKIVRTKIREMSSFFCLSKGMSGQSHNSEFFKNITSLVKEIACLTYTVPNVMECTKVFGQVEALLTGTLLFKSDTEFENDGFLDFSYNELRTTCNLQREFRKSKIGKILTKMTIPELIECTGIVKVFGYGVVEAEASWKKTHDRLINQPAVDHQVLEELESYFSYLFCRHYFFKYRRWPLMTFNRVAHRAIENAMLKNKWVSDPNIVRKFGRATFRDFRYITFDRNLAFDPYYRSEFLSKDTSIIGQRKHTMEFIESLEDYYEAKELGDGIEEAIENLKKSRLKIDERSLLASVVCTPNLNKIMYNSMKDIWKLSKVRSAKWFCEKLVIKHGETKTGAGRFFGIMTHGMRHKRSVEQHNAARIHKIIAPMNVKSANDAEIIKNMNKLVWFDKFFRKKDHRLVFTIDLDAEGWAFCHNEDVYDKCLGKKYNELFGSTAWTHVMKEYAAEVLVFHCDGVVKIFGRNCKPGQNNPRRGGQQGQKQEIWGDGYCIVIMYCLRHIEECIVINNGDNANALCSVDDRAIPVGVTPKQYITGVVEKLKEDMLKFGYKIKAEETYFSMNVMVMCKRFIESGRLIGTNIKKGVKIANEPEAALMTIEEVVASSGSALHSAVYQGMSHSVHYGLYVAQILTLFKRILGKVDKVQIARLLWRPVQLGGFAIMHWVDILVRGCSDPLSRVLSLLHYVRATQTQASGTVQWILEHTPLDKSGKPQRIVTRNPMALPIVRPRSAVQVVTAMMTKSLMNANNKDISRMAVAFDRSMRTGKEDDLTELAMSIKPFSTRVCHIIASCGDNSLINEFISKFTKSKTLINTFILLGLKAKHVDRLLNKVKEADKRYMNFLLNTPEGRIPLLENCAAKNAQALRVECYGPCVNDSYPAEVEAFRWIDDRGMADDYLYAPEFILTLNENANQQERPGHYQRLNRKVDMEWKTSGKLDVPIPEFCAGNKKYDRIRRLMKIIGHLGHVNAPLRDKLLEYIRIQDEQLYNDLAATIPSKYSGTLRHRLEMLIDDLVSGINMIAGASTNMAKELKKALGLPLIGDTSTNMILDMCFGTALICHQFLYPNDNPWRSAEYRFTFDRCDGCMHEVDDPVFNFKDVKFKKSQLFKDESEVEKQFVQQSIEEVTLDKKYQEVVSFTDQRVIVAARHILAHSYLRPKKDIAAEFARFSGYRGLTTEDISLVEDTYGIQMTGLNFSMNDLRSLPPNIILSEIISSGLYWLLFHGNYDLRYIDSAIVDITPVFDLPYTHIARELIDSGFIAPLGMYITSLGHFPPSTGETYKPVALRRYLLKTTIRIVSLYVSHGSNKQLFPRLSANFSTSPDDAVVYSKLVERLTAYMVVFGSIEHKGLRSLSPKEGLYVIAACANLEVSDVPPPNNVGISVWRPFRPTKERPKKAKELPASLKAFLGTVLTFPWWEHWSRVGSVKQREWGRFADELIKDTTIAINTLRVQEAISICRANPSQQFDLLLKSMVNLDIKHHMPGNAGLECKGMNVVKVIAPSDLKLYRERTEYVPWEDIHDWRLPRCTSFKRPLGRDVTSINKFLDLLFRHGCLPYHSNGPFACLAEGSGGVLAGLTALLKGNALFNTLSTSDSPMLPSCLVYLREQDRKRISFYRSCSMPSDLRQSSTISQLVALARQQGIEHLVLVTMDAESQQEEFGRQSLQILKNVVWLIYLIGAHDCVLVFKCSMRDPDIYNILAYAFLCFRAVSLDRSICTHWDSAEVYLVCKERNNEMIDNLHYEDTDIPEQMVPVSVHTRITYIIEDMWKLKRQNVLTKEKPSGDPRLWWDVAKVVGFSCERQIQRYMGLYLNGFDEFQIFFRSSSKRKESAEKTRAWIPWKVESSTMAKLRILNLPAIILIEEIVGILEGNMTTARISSYCTEAALTKFQKDLLKHPKCPKKAKLVDGVIHFNAEPVGVESSFRGIIEMLLRIQACIALANLCNLRID